MKKKDITIQVDGSTETGNKRVNAKSIMGMMTMGLESGEEVTVSVNGEDEDEALEQIEAYLTRVN